jgi:hypothetical protein
LDPIFINTLQINWHIAPIALAKNGEDRYTYYPAENPFRPIRKLLKI